MPPSISETYADFTSGISNDAIPAAARQAARLLILDGVGIALAASTTDFAHNAMAGLQVFGAGNIPVIGLKHRLSLRDAAIMNGVLIHGLDFDDTHLEGVVHITASAFPTALAATQHTGRSGADLVTAFVLAIEVATRLGMVAKGEMNQLGFHPSGVLAAFGAAVAAGWLMRLDRKQLTMAQGIALSMASGLREYSSNASGTKRLHPGWAANCGLNAAALAQHGTTGPVTAFEGRFGLFATHLQGGKADLPAATANLGMVWETQRVAIKPYPACQLSIACIDAACYLSNLHTFTPDNVAKIEAIVVPHAVSIVCEPEAQRLQPDSAYAAQFSLAFCVANALLHGRLGLSDVEDFRNPATLQLAQKLKYRVDPNTNYPRHFPGEIIVTLTDGRRFHHRENINLGAAENPVSPGGIREKFMLNATRAVSEKKASAIAEMILGLDSLQDVTQLTKEMAGGS
jgi:2-methylcitrate dehydratase PrpD